MFGYIFPDKAELRVRELDCYRTVYCGLCYELRSFGFGAKALLRYDFVFAAMLHMSLRENIPQPVSRRCNTNPFQKEQVLPSTPELRYAAAALVIAAHYKFVDDCRDEKLFRKIAALLARAGTLVAYKRACRELPDFDREAAALMRRQAEVETGRAEGIDASADPTAKGLSYLFENMSDRADIRRILSRLGYLVGRFAYLADAADDLADDFFAGRYNVFALRGDPVGSDLASCLLEAKAQLRLTAGEIELCYRLLQPNNYVEILDNIVYRGLFATIETLGRKKKGIPNDRSL